MRVLVGSFPRTSMTPTVWNGLAKRLRFHQCSTPNIHVAAVKAVT